METPASILDSRAVRRSRRRAWRGAQRSMPGVNASQIQNPKSEIQNPKSGFTLVEMLVAVALVVLMMVLFTTIFQVATGTMATQKGLTENDQRVRLVVSMLRNDLRTSKKDPVSGAQVPYRTFRWLVPIAPTDTTKPPPTGTGPNAPNEVDDRQGYFYISEGDPDDATDDILQFTVTMPLSVNERIFGRAGALLTDINGYYGMDSSGTGNSNPANPPYWANQPAFDALFSLPALQAGSSTAAEICYFLRNGTLYRRVMVVRLPNVLSPADDHSPEDSTNVPLPINTTVTINTTPNYAYVHGTRSFWADFDYSTFYDFSIAPPGVTFHGLSDLSFISGNLTSSLMDPRFRWGFDDTGTAGSGLGLPKEYVGTNYVGRYTHAETSDPKFGYPATITNGSAGNPLAYSNALLNYNTATGRVQYKTGGTFADFNGPRVGEDALMNNVIAFDIKVWDPAASAGPDGHPGIAGFTHPVTKVLNDDDGDGIADNVAEYGWPGSDDGDWRDIGHLGATGFYKLNSAKNAYYRSNPTGVPTGNRYDTWGPHIEIDGNPAVLDLPPYRPFFVGPDAKPGFAGVDDDLANGIDDLGELGWPGSDDIPAPLTAIKITIRFYDTTSKQIRDVSGVYRLAFEN